MIEEVIDDTSILKQQLDSYGISQEDDDDDDDEDNKEDEDE